jgi:hypothetical protein
MSTFYNSILHTHTSVHSHVFTSCCSVVASNSGHSPSSGFLNCPWPLLLASHSNSSQQLNLSSSLTNSLTDWLTQSLTNQFNSTDWTVLLRSSWHGSHWKHRSSVAVYGSLSSCLFRGHYLATGLYMVMLIVLLCDGTMCKWAVIPVFQRKMLNPSSRSKWLGWGCGQVI